MKCEDCLKVIEEYFDGELGEREALRIGAHVSTCSECARRLEDLRDEQNLYALYRREVEVSPDLWSRVEARIREEAVKRETSARAVWGARLANLFGVPRLSPAFAFALVVLAVGATAALMKLMDARTEHANPPAVSQTQKTQTPSATRDAKQQVNETSGQKIEDDKAAGASAGADDGLLEKSEVGTAHERVLTVADRTDARRGASKAEGFYDGVTPDQLVREAEQKYQAAIRLLARDAKKRRSTLDPDSLARFEQTLLTVDSTIAETRRAVRRQPDDPVAVQYMLAAYAKKVEVLREMATYRAYEGEIQ